MVVFDSSGGDFGLFMALFGALVLYVSCKGPAE